MKFWANESTECFVMSETEPAPLITVFTFGLVNIPWEEITVQEFEERVQKMQEAMKN